MRARWITGLVSLAGGLLLLAAAGCAGDEAESAQATPATKPAAEPVCPPAWKPGWQALADRIGAPVYCPSWMPNPLDGELDGQWNNIYSVDPDGSYLAGFTWYEVHSGEVHVNFRGYPGTTEIPTCQETTTVAGKTKRVNVPCFSDPQGAKRVGDHEVTVYTRNRGADQWHVLYAWELDGSSLYTLSEHIAAPLTYAKVIENLDRMLSGLVLVQPIPS